MLPNGTQLCDGKALTATYLSAATKQPSSYILNISTKTLLAYELMLANVINMDWINVEKQMPPKNIKVLGYSDEYAGEKPLLILWNGEYWEDCDFDLDPDPEYRRITERVTHWMFWEKPYVC